jgi:hypothetical protein
MQQHWPATVSALLTNFFSMEFVSFAHLCMLLNVQNVMLWFVYPAYLGTIIIRIWELVMLFALPMRLPFRITANLVQPSFQLNALDALKMFVLLVSLDTFSTLLLNCVKPTLPQIFVVMALGFIRFSHVMTETWLILMDVTSFAESNPTTIALSLTNCRLEPLYANSQKISQLHWITSKKTWLQTLPIFFSRSSLLLFINGLPKNLKNS